MLPLERLYGLAKGAEMFFSLHVCKARHACIIVLCATNFVGMHIYLVLGWQCKLLLAVVLA